MINNLILVPQIFIIWFSANKKC